MQPSREREDVDDGVESSVDDLLDDGLLDDDVRAGGSSGGTDPTAAARSAETERTGNDDAPLVGMRGRLFSGRAVLLALLSTGVGMFLGGAIPIVGGIGRFVGLFLAAFLVGLVLSERRYVETGLVGAGAAAASVLSGFLGAAFLPVSLEILQEYGVSFAVVAAVVGLVLALAGHYFGRDLRAGLVRDLK